MNDRRDLEIVRSAELLGEFRKTRPLSVLMPERVAAIRERAKNRTVAGE